MRYTLLLHYPEMTPEELGAEQLQAGMAAFQEYAAMLEEAGVLRSAEVLRDSSHTTTIRQQNGSLQVQDGPFADTREQVGGTFVIDVPDLDAALAWAERCPAAAWGSIEIRPTAVRYTEGAWTPS